MDTNVFGDPITDETLRRMPKYANRTNITCIERAIVALNSKNAGNRLTNAVQYVDNLKSEWGTGLSTRCLVYNATGNPISFVSRHNYYGELGASYPTEIANGQWGAFLHVRKKTTDNSPTPVGSTAAAVYRCKNEAGEKCDFMFAWYNLWNGESSDNKAYTEIREVGHFENSSFWDIIWDKMKQHGLNDNDEWHGCLSTVTTETAISPLFKATITLKNADAAT